MNIPPDVIKTFFMKHFPGLTATMAAEAKARLLSALADSGYVVVPKAIAATWIAEEDLAVFFTSPALPTKDTSHG